MLFNFDNSYAQLPEAFYMRWRPTPVGKPKLIAFNHNLAVDLGMNSEVIENDTELTDIFCGNRLPDGSDPIASAYGGHQFGHFVPQLGDGRALLIGEVIDQSGRRRDIQLKGSGQTPFSRRGDGRAALGPVLREYIVSEAMHALGVPTTRSLAAVMTGEQVHRETSLPGAVLTRIASSHIRVGTFEYFAARRDKASVQRLADYVIDRHYPASRMAANPYLSLLESILEVQASLIARWMHVGFIHGVMNTDNMVVSGETIDYGPCAFMDYYDPMMVFSSIDRDGRYAFGNQPLIAQWNLTRLAETLLPIFETDTEVAVSIAEAVLSSFMPRFQRYWIAGMRKKIGLATEEDGDLSLIEELLALMERNQADYTLTFRLLCQASGQDSNREHLQLLFAEQSELNAWLQRWRQRLERQPVSPIERVQIMRQANPAYIPRNHRIEEIIVAAVNHGDFSPMDRLREVLSRPYEEQADYADYMLPPQPSERVLRTFCGT